MNTNPTPLTTGKIFGDVAKKLGFQGKGVTRFIEYPAYYLVINHQKSSYGKNFYINVRIYYKELLDFILNEEVLGGALKTLLHGRMLILELKHAQLCRVICKMSLIVSCVKEIWMN